MQVKDFLTEPNGRRRQLQDSPRLAYTLNPKTLNTEPQTLNPLTLKPPKALNLEPDCRLNV